MAEENRCSQCGTELSADVDIMQTNQMEKHVTLVAIINIVFGAIGILIGLFLLVVIICGGLISGDSEAITITGIVGTTLCGFFLLLSVPEVIGGIGLLKRRGWAKILVLIISILDLANIPIGTAIGIYAIWVLLNEKTARLFTNTSTSGRK
jgi:hypothetical protein